MWPGFLLPPFFQQEDDDGLPSVNPYRPRIPVNDIEPGRMPEVHNHFADRVARMMGGGGYGDSLDQESRHDAANEAMMAFGAALLGGAQSGDFAGTFARGLESGRQAYRHGLDRSHTIQRQGAQDRREVEEHDARMTQLQLAAERGGLEVEELRRQVEEKQAALDSLHGNLESIGAPPEVLKAARSAMQLRRFDQARDILMNWSVQGIADAQRRHEIQARIDDALWFEFEDPRETQRRGIEADETNIAQSRAATRSSNANAAQTEMTTEFFRGNPDVFARKFTNQGDEIVGGLSGAQRSALNQKTDQIYNALLKSATQRYNDGQRRLDPATGQMVEPGAPPDPERLLAEAEQQARMVLGLPGAAGAPGGGATAEVPPQLIAISGGDPAKLTVASKVLARFGGDIVQALQFIKTDPRLRLIFHSE